MVQGGVPCAEEKQQPMYGTISNIEFQESHIFEAKKIHSVSLGTGRDRHIILSGHYRVPRLFAVALPFGRGSTTAAGLG